MPFYVNTQKPDSSREIARLLGNVLSVINGTGLKLCFCALEVTG